eukprot:14966738-Alexandrium_andersonii.AAC.1
MFGTQALWFCCTGLEPRRRLGVTRPAAGAHQTSRATNMFSSQARRDRRLQQQKRRQQLGASVAPRDL